MQALTSSKHLSIPLQSTTRHHTAHAQLRLLFVILAGFELVIISAALYGSLRVEKLYAEALRSRQVWNEQRGKIDELQNLAAASGLPSREDFSSGSWREGQQTLQYGATFFLKKADQFAGGLEQSQDPRTRSLAADVHALRPLMEAMLEQANEAFAAYQHGDRSQFEARVTYTDRAYQRVNLALKDLWRSTFQIEAEEFQQQAALVRHTRNRNLVLAGIALLLLPAMVWYARRLNRQMQVVEEALRQERQVLEERVRERTAELQGEVNERKRAEEAIRDTAAHLAEAQRIAHLGSWDLDIAGNRMSAEIYRLLGLTPGAIEPTPESLDQAIHPDDGLRVQEELGAALAKHQHYETEYRITRADAMERVLLVQGEPQYDEQGRAIRIAGTALDITERRQAQDAMRQAKEAAEAASRAKSDFLANMSHEIRTPLNGILGMTELTLESDLTPVQRQSLETVKSSGELLFRVISDILDFSKVEAGRLELLPTECDLPLMIGESIKMLSSTAARKGLGLDFQIAPEVPQHVVADQWRIRQVLANLLGNAIKFTDRGGVTLRVERFATDNATADILISVIDTGIGIPSDKQQLIFEPFAQADSSPTRRHGGTGLGLTICSRLVSMMGGRIWVESEDGKGSVFRFTVKVGLAAMAAPPQPRTKIASLAQLRQARPKLRVLAAEDNPTNQAVAVRMLEGMGHLVVVANDGEEALRKLVSDEYDVVLMDIQMPNMDGFEATAAIRSHERELQKRHLPIIAMTAHAITGYRKRCLDSEMDGYLSKPLRAPELAEVLENVTRVNVETAAPRAENL